MFNQGGGQWWQRGSNPFGTGYGQGYGGDQGNQFGGNPDYLGQYRQAGGNALNQYMGGYGAMGDPQAFYNKMMQGYQESPEAKAAIAQGIKASNAAGAASGMIGSGAQQTALQKQGQDIMNQDQQNWYNNMMGIYNGYLQGAGNVANMGYGAAGQSGNLGYNYWNAQNQQNQQDQANQQGMFNNLGGFVGGILGKIPGLSWL